MSSIASPGRSVVKTVMMDYSLLAIGERWMKNLLDKARLVSVALQAAGIPHAVIGGLAVAAHVARKDEAAVRNTRDIDILLRHDDLERAAASLKPLGFRYRKVLGIPAFIPAGGKFRDAVHMVWAGEKVRSADILSAPEVNPKQVVLSRDGFRCLALPELLRMKLTSFRLKDRVHIQDLLQLGLITSKVRARLAPDLQARLREVEDETKRERLR